MDVPHTYVNKERKELNVQTAALNECELRKVPSKFITTN